MVLQGMFFLVFTSYIYSQPQKGISLKSTFLEGSFLQYIFFLSRWFLSGTPQGTHAMETRAVNEQLGHALVTSWLRHSSHSWYVTLANDHMTRTESMLYPQSKQKMESGQCSKPTVMHKVRSENHRRSGRRGICLGKCVRYHVRQDNLREWWLQMVSALSESGKCITKMSFTNESKTSAIGTPVWIDGVVNLRNIWHSDYSCGCWFLLFTVSNWMLNLALVTAGYMRCNIF